MNIISFLVGLVISGIVGLLVLAMCSCSKDVFVDSDERKYRDEGESKNDK